MNVKLHTPKSLMSGSGLSSMKQFMLSLIATTISIILTFGTAAIIDHYKKNAAKKEMVMMVINDFDKTIELIEKVDTGLRECRRLQHDIALHPEHFDSLLFLFAPAMTWNIEEFSETTEKIFSSNIETFNTIGNVNFVNEVSSFYLTRRVYKDNIIDELREAVKENRVLSSLKSLISVDFPEYTLLNSEFLEDIKEQRVRCMQMMNVSEEDMNNFSKKHIIKKDNPDRNARTLKMMEEYDNYNAVLEQAREKVKD